VKTVAPHLLGPAEMLVSDRDFLRFQALVHRLAGIWLGPAKRALLAGRLARRVRELGLASFAEYYARVEADPNEQVQMLDRITTNETHFSREPRHFEFLEEVLLPRWRADADAGRRPRRIRCWSAACSTGEEPYSLAMTLLRGLPDHASWELDVLGSDLSTRVLERARSATWPIECAKEIAERDLKAFMLRGTGGQEGKMRAAPELRALVRFARVNLLYDDPPPPGPFDLLFCRNVLIYFDAATKVRVVRRLLDHLAPGGHLFLGHAESLTGMSLPVRCLAPTIYARREPALVSSE
jgi:chemotaxis protein methyltransferase CheR